MTFADHLSELERRSDGIAMRRAYMPADATLASTLNDSLPNRLSPNVPDESSLDGMWSVDRVDQYPLI